MKLFPGCQAEYQKRHDNIWPELVALLKDTGVSDYSIFFDQETNLLFAYLTIQNQDLLKELPSSALMQKWWHYMKDIMESNPDGSPVTISLKELFYLP